MAELTDWDRRYAARSHLFHTEPDSALIEFVSPLTPGRAVDLGAGEGRNTRDGEEFAADVWTWLCERVQALGALWSQHRLGKSSVMTVLTLQRRIPAVVQELLREPLEAGVEWIKERLDDVEDFSFFMQLQKALPETITEEEFEEAQQAFEAAAEAEVTYLLDLDNPTEVEQGLDMLRDVSGDLDIYVDRLDEVEEHLSKLGSYEDDDMYRDTGSGTAGQGREVGQIHRLFGSLKE